VNAIARSLAVVAALLAAPALAHERHPAPPPPAPAVPLAPPYAGQPQPGGYAEPVYPAPAYAAPVQAPPAPYLESGGWAPAYAGPVQAPPAPYLEPGGWAPRHGFQLRQLRWEYRRLERDRERFYASWRGNPFAQRRFESWYGVRRAELDRRYEWLLARREHRGHEGRFAWNGRDHHDD